MNESFTIIGALAISFMVASYFAYRISSRFIGLRSEDRQICSLRMTYNNNSTLDEDLRDLMDCIPMNSINEILHDYLMYDKQVADTYSFIDDQMKFISKEFETLPHTPIILTYLREAGLSVETLKSRIKSHWKNLPSFERSKPEIANGGLTVMIRKMVRQLPHENLHILLFSKVQCSESFRIFVMLLGSPLFSDMCQEIGKNDVLRRHYYWAMEAGIEVTFAIELFYALCFYLVHGLV